MPDPELAALDRIIDIACIQLLPSQRERIARAIIDEGWRSPQQAVVYATEVSTRLLADREVVAARARALGIG